jgi:tetratricopeptide (TPR) repeat protein
MKWADALKSILIVPLAYGLIFFLYIVNKPHALKIQEPAVNIYHVLDQEMLREGDYAYLLDMQRRGIAPYRGVLREFEHYFQLVVDSFPNQPDSYGMLGYCQYYLGQESQAINSYQTAIQMNPAFVGFYYNLAVIYYNRGDYSEAAVLLQKALEVPLQAEVQSILSSVRIYKLMVMQMPGNFPQNIIQMVINQRQKALELLKLTTEQAEHTAPSFNPGKIALDLI